MSNGCHKLELFRTGFSQLKGIQAEVKRVNYLCFWVQTLKKKDFSLTIQLGTILNEDPPSRLDRWTQVIGPELKPCWVRLVGDPSPCMGCVGFQMPW